MGLVVTRLRRAAFRKGVLGTSRGWFAAWAALAAVNGVRKMTRREAPVVDRIVLKPGQTIELRDTSVSVEEYDSTSGR